MTALETLFSAEELQKTHPDTLVVLKKLPWKYIPMEGALFYQSWVSKEKMPTGEPAGTAILAMYCEHPFSASCFHRLDYDEVWHFYGGDPLRLFLLYPDGTSNVVTMGNNFAAGEEVQFTIPAGTWQAGELIPGGRYSLFGCTLGPGFTLEIFEGGTIKELVPQYPEWEEVIKRLNLQTMEDRLPAKYKQL